MLTKIELTGKTVTNLAKHGEKLRFMSISKNQKQNKIKFLLSNVNIYDLQIKLIFFSHQYLLFLCSLGISAKYIKENKNEFSQCILFLMKVDNV